MLPLHGVWVQSLVRALNSHKLHSAVKKKIIQRYHLETSNFGLTSKNKTKQKPEQAKSSGNVGVSYMVTLSHISLTSINCCAPLFEVYNCAVHCRIYWPCVAIEHLKCG